MAFALYLDDSDSDVGPVVCMGGYLARIEAWELFEREVAPLFDEFGVEILHSMKFQKTDGVFSGWSREKKIEFSTRLYDLAKRHIPFGVVTSVKKKDFARYIKPLKGFEGSSMISVAFQSCFDAAFSFGNRRSSIMEEGISIVVEAGNKNNASIERMFRHMQKQEGIYGNCLKSISFVPKNFDRAVQLADFAAFHGRRAQREWFKHELPNGYSDPIFGLMLSRIPHRLNRIYGKPEVGRDISYFGIPGEMREPLNLKGFMPS